MKKSLFSISMAVVLAATSQALWASSVTIPNAFGSGTTAVATEVNANFDALAIGVNDNDSRVTANASAISAIDTSGISTNAAAITTNSSASSTNSGDITTNTANITTNAAAITTNSSASSTNSGDIVTNTADIATNAAASLANTTASGINTTDIAALQAAAACPSDMVASGSMCVDIYEASVFDAATGGSQIADVSALVTCLVDGIECGANAAEPIFARSVPGVLPAVNISWYQASQACANVGKRLPTTNEWQMAASGTPSGDNADNDVAEGCNIGITPGPAIVVTGASSTPTVGATCTSSAGAFDMLGNVWEWVAELTDLTTGGGFVFLDVDNAVGRIFGSAFDSDGSTNGLTNTRSVATVGAGPTRITGVVGFRCVR